jgi:hypothetical protein
LLGAISLACTTRPATTPVGVSDSEPEQTPARALAAAATPWSDFASALAWPEAAPAWRALAHRRDGTLIRVRIDPALPEALAAYRALSVESHLPDGARIIAWHETPSGTLLSGYLLEKHGGNWSALEVDARGSVIPGDRAACVRCHDMAPTDHLFGPVGKPPSAAPSAPALDHPSGII